MSQSKVEMRFSPHGRQVRKVTYHASENKGLKRPVALMRQSATHPRQATIKDKIFQIQVPSEATQKMFRRVAMRYGVSHTPLEESNMEKVDKGYREDFRSELKSYYYFPTLDAFSLSFSLSLSLYVWLSSSTGRFPFKIQHRRLLAVLPTRKHGRGAAKNLEFDKIRKFGPIALIIKDGETSPCCENYTIFTSRWLVTHHVDLSHSSWHDLPDNEKEELIARVQADFVLDWMKMNHRDTVTKILRKRFNHIRYELHKIYKSYKTNEEALANMPELVTATTWVKLSARWSSVEFMISLIDVDCAIFYMFII
ncbi:uncharacterized protein LOC122301681 [Carya illinoinensis]|uniref:uncharacterized protein LOC122301681 n=1 Tax=Carya illinoinensis TaxID=32201 RepID=UPI001C717CBF|nr:uncharacterized protein LOC122301681 [Carya illinoinensis]